MIADIKYATERLEQVIAQIEEDCYLLEVRRPLFWRIQRWLLRRERSLLMDEIDVLRLRQEWRAMSQRALISEEK